MLAEPVSHIYNRSVKDGHVSSSWKKANVVPVAKTRQVQSVESDLCPISLTPTICKVLESFVGRRILAAIADKFDTKQFGALRGRSTTHALIDILLCGTKLLINASLRELFL